MTKQDREHLLRHRLILWKKFCGCFCYSTSFAIWPDGTLESEVQIVDATLVWWPFKLRGRNALCHCLL